MSRVGSRLVGRLLAEFAIIFVGVVLAFQFENWREARADREREAEALEALAADFSVNRSRLSTTLRSQNNALHFSRTWLRAVAGDPNVPYDSLAYMWPGALSWYQEETLSGAFDALTSSGDIGLLRDAGLRSRLAEFYGVVDAGFEDTDNEMDLLWGLTDISAEVAGPMLAPDGIPRDGPRDIRIFDRDVPKLEELLANDRLYGMLAWKVIVANNRQEHLAWLNAQADTIAMRIEELRSAGR